VRESLAEWQKGFLGVRCAITTWVFAGWPFQLVRRARRPTTSTSFEMQKGERASAPASPCIAHRNKRCAACWLIHSIVGAATMVAAAEATFHQISGPYPLPALQIIIIIYFWCQPEANDGRAGGRANERGHPKKVKKRPKSSPGTISSRVRVALRSLAQCYTLNCCFNQRRGERRVK